MSELVVERRHASPGEDQDDPAPNLVGMVEHTAGPGIAADQSMVVEPAPLQAGDKARVLQRQLLGHQKFVGRDAWLCAGARRPVLHRAGVECHRGLEQITARHIVGRHEGPPLGAAIEPLLEHDRLETHARPEVVRRPHIPGRRLDLGGAQRIERAGLRDWGDLVHAPLRGWRTGSARMRRLSMRRRLRRCALPRCAPAVGLVGCALSRLSGLLRG